MSLDLSSPHTSFILDNCEKTSNPPSVVSSCRFSGTKQQSSGNTLEAKISISSVAAISRFILVFSFDLSSRTS